MTTDLELPPERPLPTGRHDIRRNHLLAEIRREPARRSRLRLLGPPPRVLAAALAGSAATVVLAAVAVQEFRGADRGGSETVRVVVAPSGPVSVWNGMYLAGGCLGLGFLDDCGMGSSSDVFSIDIPRGAAGPAPDGLELVGGTPAERQVLQGIAERMPGNAISRVEVVAADGGVTLRFAATGGDGLRNDWEQMLFAGAYRDLASREGLRAVVGFPSPTAVASPDPSAHRRVEARLRAAASAAGATIDELTLYEPDRPAVLVVLRVSDPGRFLEQRLAGVLEALGDRWRDYEGTFVEVVDDDGAFVWAAGTVPRTAHGSVGTREDLEGCSPVPHWGPTPPPCPGS